MRRYAARAAALLVPAAALARLGIPALGALVLLAVLVLATACWVIGSQDRTNRASQILRACRGVAAEPAQTVLPARTGMLRRTLKLVASRKTRGAR